MGWIGWLGCVRMIVARLEPARLKQRQDGRVEALIQGNPMARHRIPIGTSVILTKGAGKVASLESSDETISVC